MGIVRTASSQAEVPSPRRDERPSLEEFLDRLASALSTGYRVRLPRNLNQCHHEDLKACLHMGQLFHDMLRGI